MSDATTADNGATGLPAVSSGAGTAGVEAWRSRMSGFFAQPAIARSLPMLGLLGIVAAAGIAWLSLREAPQRDLFRGLPDADKSAVVEVLGKSNIPYEFDSTSGSITVGEADYFKAKMLLASEGLPKAAPDGNSLIDSLPMGASHAVEGEKLRSAREMDLARTIEQVDAVESARVHLAVQAPSVFLRDRTKPSASVMLRLANGRSLSDSQVQAIVHLVASSVSDLAPEDVSVVAQDGKLLSRADGLSGETDRQLGVQSQIEERYRQQVIALLTPIVGAGKFSAEVHAEVNFAERQATRETYPQDEARLRVETGSWEANPNGSGREVGGIPGALSNQAPPPVVVGTQQGAVAQANPQTVAGANTAPLGAPGAAPSKTQESYNRSFELGREVSVTKDAVGTVKRLSVAVALDYGANGKARTGAEIAALDALVKGAIGFDQTRGDVVALSSRKFVGEEPVAEKWYEADWVAPLGRNLSALAVALVLIFGIGRPLLKRRAALAEEAAAERAVMRQRIGREISGELSRSGGSANSGRITLDMISSTPDYAQRADLIRDFVKEDPDRAALVVRDLLKEGKAKANA
jgi:flagellar M-ring protein FliF